MKVGYFAVGIGPTVNPGLVRTIATTAERLGFATIWAPEHVVLLEEYASKYPYSSGKFPAPPDIPIADPFTTLAYAAACTSKIRLGTGICLVPEHNPLVLAKTVATVDRLSNGRFIFGVGVGWLAEEFQGLGISFDRRAQRTREYIDVMRKLWAERTTSHQGEFVNFTSVLSYPKPVSEKGVPVWFGGESGPALRRVAEYGDGWIGFNLLPDQDRRLEALSRCGSRGDRPVVRQAGSRTGDGCGARANGAGVRRTGGQVVTASAPPVDATELPPLLADPQASAGENVVK